MAAFPTSKIELHQWANTLLLSIVGFFVVQTYITIQEDHERIGKHDTEIAVVKEANKSTNLQLNNLIGRVDKLRELNAN